MAHVKKKIGGPNPKHVPQRTCIACRRADTKRTLMRLVRNADGQVALDPTGKQAGRGAYLCHNPACWEQALKRHGLERALRVEVLRSEDRQLLEQIARGLVALQEGESKISGD